MKKLIILLIIVVSSNLNAKSQNEADEKINQVIKNIQAMEIYYKKLPPDEQVKAKNFLDSTILILKSIKKNESYYELYVVNDDDFNRILGEIKKQISDDSKLKFIKSTFKKSKITSEQLRLMLKELAWDDSKLELIKYLESNIIDRHNIYHAVEVVDSSLKRDEIIKNLEE